MMRLALLALLSHWRRHLLQCLAIFAGLWLATALWTGVQALNNQARADYARASATLTGPAQSQVVPRHGDLVDQSAYVALRQAGWPVSPVLEGRLRVAGENGPWITVIGIDPLTLPYDASVAGQSGGEFDLGHFAGSPGQAWIAPDTLRRLGLAAGDAAPTADGQHLPPARVQAQLAPGVIVVDIGHAQALLRTGPRLSRMMLPADFPDTALPAAQADSLQLRAPARDDDLQRLTDSFHLNLTALGFLAFVVGLFIVNAAIGLALEQRRGVLRTLRACGVSLRGLVAALAVELGLFALLGGLAGVASGYLLATLLLPDVAASLRGLYGAEVSGQLSLSPQWWLAGIGMSVLGALAAGAGSLLQAARLPLLAIAQPQAWRAAQSRRIRWQLGAAAVLSGVAVLCWQFGHSLLTGFMMVAAILLAAAMLLPAVLDGLLALFGRLAHRPLAQWFIADSRQQLPALTLALTALLLALAASVGVGSMTEGFRKTFVGWLDQRLAADLYVAPRDTAQGLEIADWLRTRPGVTATLPRWRTDLRVAGWPVEAQGLVDHPSYAAHWPLLAQTPDAWQRVARGEGVMLSEQLANRVGARLGTVIELPLPDGVQRLPVVAWYADYGNPKGQIVLAADWLRRHDPDATLHSLHLYTAPGQADAVRAALEAQYTLQGSNLIDQAALKQWSIGVFDRTFTATAALNTLTLLVAGVALLMSLLTLSHSRLGQLAPLWALGVGRRQLAGLALAQTLMLAALTVLLAMPLGLLLAWCMVAVINVQAFGWRLPLQIFPLQLLQLGLLGLITALLAAAGPLWQLARRQPADLLRQFANER